MRHLPNTWRPLAARAIQKLDCFSSMQNTHKYCVPIYLIFVSKEFSKIHLLVFYHKERCSAKFPKFNQYQKIVKRNDASSVK